MTVLGEPIPIPPDAPNAQFMYNGQISQLAQQLRNISLTQRDGVIQDDDKAGNLNAVYVVFTSNGTADTEDTVSHNLGRVPVGYAPVKQDKSAILYDGTTAATSTAIYWRSSATSVAWVVLVF